MSKQLTDKLRELFEAKIEELGYELVDVEFLQEGADRFLRFYIYNPEGTTVDDCERVSELLDEKLDELDLIKSSYYLEVSSPDLNRPLKTDDDLRRNLGVILDLNLYRKINGQKQYRGKLLDYDDDRLEIETDKGVIELQRKDISKITVAIIF